MTDSTSAAMSERMRAVLFFNGTGLIALALLLGWVWFFALLGKIVLWPLPIDIAVAIPDDGRAWRMAHMEAITQGLLLMGFAFGGRYMRLSPRQFTCLFWSALVSTWLFTLTAAANAMLGACASTACAKPCKPKASTRCWCPAPTRTCRNTCRRAGRDGSGCRASPARWARWSAAQARGAVRRQPLLGAGRAPNSPAAASSSCASPTAQRLAHIDWLASSTCRAAAAVAVDGQVLGLAAAQR
jgi:hypothetical protein